MLTVKQVRDFVAGLPKELDDKSIWYVELIPEDHELGYELDPDFGVRIVGDSVVKQGA